MTSTSKAVHWTYLHGNWILCPPNPIGLIHFLGGAFVASAPQLTYNTFLSRLAEQGFGVIATPFLVQPNHDAIAQEITLAFKQAHRHLNLKSDRPRLPIFGMGHSLGAKLQLLLTCQNALPRQGNILIAFNNFDSDRAIPFSQVLAPFGSLAFSPSPAETLARIQADYQQPQTLVLRFQTDTLDESDRLIPIFQSRFPQTFMHQKLRGDHLTPLEPDVSSTRYRSRLEQVTVKWLTYQHHQLQRSTRDTL